MVHIWYIIYPTTPAIKTLLWSIIFLYNKTLRSLPEIWRRSILASFQSPQERHQVDWSAGKAQFLSNHRPVLEDSLKRYV